MKQTNYLFLKFIYDNCRNVIHDIMMIMISLTFGSGSTNCILNFRMKHVHVSRKIHDIRQEQGRASTSTVDITETSAVSVGAGEARSRGS